MSLPLVLRVEARRGFDDAFNWYEERRSGLGVDFAANVQDALDRIVRDPCAFRPVHRDIRKAIVKRFPYCVYYRVESEQIVVVSIDLEAAMLDQPRLRSAIVQNHQAIVTRRHYLGLTAVGAAAFWTPGAFADELMKTPRQTEGPFYPDKLPLDTDNDLIIVNDSITPAVGEITHLTGRVLDVSGNPIRNALVEIWQVDAKGAYLHSGSNNRDKRDSNFQGFGRFLTGSNGDYYFRTIKPVAYPGRTPHIHVKVKKGKNEILVTQCYIKGEPRNEKDGVLRGIRDEKDRNSVIVAFEPVKGSRIGELQAKFDMVIGLTPEA